MKRYSEKCTYFEKAFSFRNMNLQLIRLVGSYVSYLPMGMAQYEWSQGSMKKTTNVDKVFIYYYSMLVR